MTDQIPTKLAPETLKNSNLKIVHRLVAPDDRQIAGNCINLNDQQMRHLNNLAPGYAIVHNERIGEAVLTKIHQAQEVLQLVAGTPPRILERCQQCPIRCRMLAYVAPHLKKLERSIATNVAGNQSATTRLEVIHRTAEQHIPLLTTRKDDKTTSQ